MKYSILALCQQDVKLEALNSRVEYRKCLFLFAIVLCELISSSFTILTGINSIFYFFSNHSNILSHNHDRPAYNMEGARATNLTPSYDFPNYSVSVGFNGMAFHVAFGIPLVLAFSMVYTLMSYYVMVTKKSLNYNNPLKSVELASKHKFFLLSSSLACVILFLLLLSEEVYIILHIFECCIVTVQLVLTFHYRAKLICVIKWKKLDAKIAFGKDHYLFKSYSNTLRKFKRFTFIYIIIVASFYLHVIFRIPIVLLTEHKEWFRVLTNALLIHFDGFKEFSYIASTSAYILEEAALSLSLICLFFLNICSLPFLLSKTNITPQFNCKHFCFRVNMNLREPLLNNIHYVWIINCT
ncbi:hypothetical protein LOD99_3646 [Oopsacas minuta]|uniref:Uncharacterized protein n=1 Tax=Oopsacas minuta TaxID=111878 RepID=A0AAV7JX43_9METZ|nr:hypothetical protein LOD99_3646 [Oopsacas minuta]